ncbi:hypothetical protein JD844_004859 [Phrynosoma platyrhinos]|uniref:Uncharacterized protein n=1 Tax=Phrynosoma platyrhinos TaxID=52577 RepID=A0ABQ7SDW7_PHRPL|nr:hypothetical protein JD844_004859 [Phrynosoma platyrhinos]
MGNWQGEEGYFISPLHHDFNSDWKPHACFPERKETWLVLSMLGPSEVSAAVRFNRRPTCPDASVAASLPTPPVPRHRKSHSLGNNMMCQFSVVESKSATFPTEKPRHLLDDSVLESHSPVRNHTLNSVFTNGISIGSSESSEFSEEPSSGLERRLQLHFSDFHGSCYNGRALEKKNITEGRQEAYRSTLIYFGAKSLRGAERKHYKSTPGKKVSIVGWMVALPDDPEHPDIFQLNNPDKGTCKPYVIRITSPGLWCNFKCQTAGWENGSQRRTEEGNSQSEPAVCNSDFSTFLY